MKFKLKPYNFNISDQELLDDLKKVASELQKKSITGKEYNENGKFSGATFENRFGTWNNAVQLAGLEKTERQRNSDVELIEDLIRVSQEFNKKTITGSEYKVKGKFHVTTLERRFKGWNNALIKAGLEPPNRNISNEELIADLKKVAMELEKETISNLEYNKKGMFGTSIIIKRFKTWNNALIKANLKISVNRNISNKELIEDLQRVAEIISPQKLTHKDYKKFGTYGYQTIIRNLGGWNNALEKAGLEISINQIISEEELFQNLKEVWIKLGQQPSAIHMKKSISKYSGWRYAEKYGSWRKALEAFIIYINTDTEQNEEVEANATNISHVDALINGDKEKEHKGEKVNMELNNVIETSGDLYVDSHGDIEEVAYELKSFNSVEEKKVLIKHKTKRSISGKLKVQVLIRDGNTCRLCGITVTGKNIHFDHIKPWSKGGETVFENIQVLCAEHNLAKSNYFEEE